MRSLASHCAPVLSPSTPLGTKLVARGSKKMGLSLILLCVEEIQCKAQGTGQAQSMP